MAESFKVRPITRQHALPSGEWQITLHGKHFAYANSLSAAQAEIEAAIGLSECGFYDIPINAEQVGQRVTVDVAPYGKSQIKPNTGVTFKPSRTFGELLENDLKMMRSSLPALLDTDPNMPTMTSRKCAEMLGVSLPTFWRRVADGTIPKPIKLGGLSRWMRTDIEKVVSDATTRRSA